MGDLVRQALKLGYQVLPYEVGEYQMKDIIHALKKGNASINEEDPTTQMNVRDLAQAKNIATVFEKDKDAKILVHAGFGHIREKKVRFWFPLAYKFQEITGIDPVTIDQVQMSEKGYRNIESPYYGIVSIEKPSVFVKESGDVFVAPEYDLIQNKDKIFYDIQVFHPRTKYPVFKRPSWLLMNGYRKPVAIKKYLADSNCPCLVAAYYENEDVKRGVPVDLIEVKDASNSQALMLPKKQNYAVVIFDQEKKKQQIQISVQ